MIDYTQVGAHVSTDAAGHLHVNLGIYLPGISQANGYLVSALIIHADDQFTPEIPPVRFPLGYSNPAATYELWSADIDLSANTQGSGSFGKPGQYLYRFQLSLHGNVIVNWFTDPYAREAASGELGLFDTQAVPYVWNDAAYKTPNLDDLIVYELQIEQFNTTFDGVIERLPYLMGLGVNCIELMPVTSQKKDFDWGYGPLHFLAINQTFGPSDSLRRLVDACHQRGIAVILDSVYQHVDPDFAYCSVYRTAGIPSPMIRPDPNPLPSLWFGPQTAFEDQFTQDYFLAVNQYFLNEFHVDGFRYDYVAGYYDQNPATKYGTLVYNTYQASIPIPRFQNPAGYSGILQVAEDLDTPQAILQQTYTVATWQNNLLSKCEDMAMWNYVDEAFVHDLLLDLNNGGYPNTQSMNGVQVPVAPFQYTDSHDHSFLVTFVGNTSAGNPDIATVYAGDRSIFYKLQPFAIALYTCRGVPMLWEGQEFADDYVLPNGGDLRIHFQRDMNWSYFYDAFGNPLITLYRKLAKLRRNLPALRSRDSFYYNVQSRPGEGIIAYHRHAAATATAPEQFAIVFLNFSGVTQTISIPAPSAGTYKESLDANPTGVGPLTVVIANVADSFQVSVPSNYGYVYVKQ